MAHVFTTFDRLHIAAHFVSSMCSPQDWAWVSVFACKHRELLDRAGHGQAPRRPKASCEQIAGHRRRADSSWFQQSRRVDHRLVCWSGCIVPFQYVPTLCLDLRHSARHEDDFPEQPESLAIRADRAVPFFGHGLNSHSSIISPSSYMIILGFLCKSCRFHLPVSAWQYILAAIFYRPAFSSISQHFCASFAPWSLCSR